MDVLRRSNKPVANRLEAGPRVFQQMILLFIVLPGLKSKRHQNEDWSLVALVN